MPVLRADSLNRRSSVRLESVVGIWAGIVTLRVLSGVLSVLFALTLMLRPALVQSGWSG
jgi:hypothetical protein